MTQVRWIAIGIAGAALCVAAPPAATQETIAAWIEGIGGSFQKNSAGRITEVDLIGTWVTDDDLTRIGALADLRKIDLSHTKISDLGLAHLRPLKNVVSLQPGDKVSAQLLDHIQPGAASVPAQPLDPGRMPGVWVAQAPPNAKITLSMSDDANFTWAIAAPGKPPVTITGTYTLSDGVLTLAGRDAPGGPLAGKVVASDDTHMNFKAVGSPPSDPGLQFAR